MTTPDGRLGAAIARLAGAGAARFDVRATIALSTTVALLAMAAAGITVPGELWLAYGAIIGYFFPRPTEPTARA